MENKKIASQQTKLSVAPDCLKPPSKTHKVITPTQTLLSTKNFKKAVNFHSEEKLPCKNTWYRDVRSTHIRNKRLLDLPFPNPKCCADIYNISVDHQKLRKLKKYNLTRPVRTIIPCKEAKPVEVCKPEPMEKMSGLLKPHTVIFPECYILPESDSDSDSENMVYEYCKSGSISECSMCSDTPKCGIRKKIHRVMKSDWRDLLHTQEAELCKDIIKQELRKHKLGMDFKLKLNRNFF